MIPMLAALATLALSSYAQGATVSLDEARRTLVQGPQTGEVDLSGHATIYGVSTKYTLRFAPKGRFVQDFQGPLSEKFVSDGTHVWKVNRDGVPREQTFEDLDEIFGETLLLTDRWSDSDSPATARLGQGKIELHMADGLVETISLDPVTHLPASASFKLSAGPIRLDFSDWKGVNGRMYPFHAVVHLPEEVRTYDVDSAHLAASTQNAMPYLQPARRNLEVTFSATAPSALEVKRAISGHIMVKPVLNGKDVGWFILDTGAESMCIDPKVADQLGLTKVGTLPITGVGGTVKGSFRPVGSFTLGPATMHGVYFVELDLADIARYLGMPIAGVVGDEFFDRSIVAIDVAKPSVTVSDPTKYRLPDSSNWSAMRFESGNPLIEATANGKLDGWYRFDTGDPNTVTFHAPYVKKEHLLEGVDTAAAMSGGVGGEVGARQGKVRQFEFGGHRFENVEATYSLAGQGAFADLYVAGNIGQTLMRPFTVVLDYANSRIAFLPRKSDSH